MNQGNLDSQICLALTPPTLAPPHPQYAFSPALELTVLPSVRQPDGVCRGAPDHLQVGGELCEPGQRPPGEAAGLPGRHDG